MYKFTWVLYLMMYLCWSQTEAVVKVKNTKTQSGDSLLIHLVNVVNRLMNQQEKMEKMLKTQEKSLLIHKQEIRQIQNSLTINVVGFCVALDHIQWTGGKVAFNRILSNYGNGWDRITHTFKVPTKGLYFITLKVMSSGSSPAGAFLRRGSTNIQSACACGGGGSIGTSSVVLMLYPGEHIYAQYWGGIIQSDKNLHTFLTGFLIRKVI